MKNLIEGVTVKPNTPEIVALASQFQTITRTIRSPPHCRQPTGGRPGAAAINFVVNHAGSDAYIVSTETRVYATDVSARRKFARY